MSQFGFGCGLHDVGWAVNNENVIFKMFLIINKT